MSDSVIPWTAACHVSLSITNSQSLLKLMSFKSVMPSNHLCQPLLLLTSIFPVIQVFSNESILLIRCPTNWSFSFSISPSNEHSGLTFFRMDWLDLLALEGLKGNERTAARGAPRRFRRGRNPWLLISVPQAGSLAFAVPRSLGPECTPRDLF